MFRRSVSSIHEGHPHRTCKAENDSSLLSSPRQKKRRPHSASAAGFNLAVGCTGPLCCIRNGSSGRVSIGILLDGKTGDRRGSHRAFARVPVLMFGGRITCALFAVDYSTRMAICALVLLSLHCTPYGSSSMCLFDMKHARYHNVIGRETSAPQALTQSSGKSEKRQ